MARISTFLIAALAALLLVPSAAPAADTVAPVASFTAPATLRAPVVVRFNETVRGVTQGNVVARVAGTTVNLPARLTCSNSSGAAVSCSTGSVRTVNLRALPALVAGQVYSAIVNPSGSEPVRDASSNAPARATKTFRASMVEEELSASGAFSWRKVSDDAAFGGSYDTEQTRAATAIFGFTGTSVTWYTRKGPDQGTAKVFIDGTLKTTANNYAATPAPRAARRFAGLASGRHTIKVVVLAEKGSAEGTGEWIVVDGFAVNGIFVDAPVITFRWRTSSDSSAFGGRHAASSAPGARASFTFRGKGVDWYSVTGPDRGKAQVYIDGTLKRTVDEYSATAAYGVRHAFAGLTDTVHAISVVATGQKRAASTGSTVSVDRWVVRYPSAASFRRLGVWIDLFDYGVPPADGTAVMKSHGVDTLYIETARYNSDSAFDYPEKIGEWLEAAHARGIKVVGWYFPAYSEFLDTDVQRTADIATFRSPAGEAFDALAIDIEYKGESSSLTEWNAGIKTHIARVRSKVGNRYPIGAIVPSPVAMEIRPNSWTGFPWATLGRYADAVLPMAYWSYRKDCDTKPQHCPYEYARGNVAKARAFTKLPVHIIGGIGNAITLQGLADFVRGTRAERGYGGSFYDYRTTKSAFWSELEKLNAL